MIAAEDDLILEDDNNDLENLHESEVEADGNKSDGEIKSDSEEASNENKAVKPKRVVRNPRPKLNVDTLQGPKGLKLLPDLFAKEKFRGKGHEEEDLRKLLKTYEYWCHRMFPKCPFDECVERLEILGHKKPVINLIRKIRAGLLIDEPVVQFEEEEDAQPDPEPADTRFDDLHRDEPEVVLTDEQLEMIRLNRERAQKLREEVLKKARDKAAAILPGEMTAVTEESEVVAGPSGVRRRRVVTSSDEEAEVSCQKKRVILSDSSDEDTPGVQNVVIDNVFNGTPMEKDVGETILDKDENNSGVNSPEKGFECSEVSTSDKIEPAKIDGLSECFGDDFEFNDAQLAVVDTDVAKYNEKRGAIKVKKFYRQPKSVNLNELLEGIENEEV